MIRYYLPVKLLLSVKIFLVCFVISLIIPACDQIDQKETKKEKSYKENLDAQNNLIVLGNDQAPIKIKIFSSLTCPHCADFHIKVVPELKREYIDSGKAQIIFIDFPLDEAAFNAAKLLHCSHKGKQMEFITPIFKWLHIIAGVLWIGLLYFFNWINGHVVGTMDADTKKKVVPELMPRTLYFFRWGAAWTWITGVVLLLIVYWMNMNDSMFRELDMGEEANKFKHLAYLIPFLMVFVYDAFYKSSLAKDTRIATLISYAGIAGVLGFLIFVAEMTAYRAYNIHIGTMFGSMMAFNVWYRIWPAQQRIITAIKNGEAPDPADAGMAGLRSKHNTYMSFPLIWTMINEHTVGVSHYLEGYGVLLVMIALGWHIVWQIYKKSATIKGF